MMPIIPAMQVRLASLAIGGVMGGADSAVSDNTVDLFVESAFFDPATIAVKTRAYGLTTDSAHRFERGVDYAATRSALERTTRLIVDLCGGKVGPITEIIGKLPQRVPIQLRTERLKRVLGIPLDVRTVSPILRRLQFSSVVEHDVFYVTPHSYRFDLVIEEDLIEEVARLYGYDKIIATNPKAELKMLPQPETILDVESMKNTLVARDYQEVVTYSFVPEEWGKDFTPEQKPVLLKNPISSEMTTMRSSLLGGLLSCLSFNLNRQHAAGICFRYI